MIWLSFGSNRAKVDMCNFTKNIQKNAALYAQDTHDMNTHAIWPFRLKIEKVPVEREMLVILRCIKSDANIVNT